MVKDLVSITCPQCGNPRVIHRDVAVRYRREGRVKLCRACAVKGRVPKAPSPRMCRHCGLKAACRPKQLCWTCSRRPDVREQYESESVFGRRGVPDPTGPLPPPDAPTTAAPGTAEKIAVMRERALAGRALFHTHDAQYHGDERASEYLKGRGKA